MGPLGASGSPPEQEGTEKQSLAHTTEWRVPAGSNETLVLTPVIHDSSQILVLQGCLHQLTLKIDV